MAGPNDPDHSAAGLRDLWQSASSREHVRRLIFHFAAVAGAGESMSRRRGRGHCLELVRVSRTKKSRLGESCSFYRSFGRQLQLKSQLKSQLKILLVATGRSILTPAHPPGDTGFTCVRRNTLLRFYRVEFRGSPHYLSALESPLRNL
jgi:hypothetical protein